MNTNTQEVKKDAGDASNQQGVETKGSDAPQDKLLGELASTVDALAAENEKLKADNENYKTGMLTYKNKLKDAGFDEEPDTANVAEVVGKILDEKLAPIYAKINTPQNDPLVVNAYKKIDELKTALTNRSGIGNSGQGSSTEAQQVKDNFFTEAQLAELKSRGLDPDKVKANMLKRKDAVQFVN